MKDIVVSILMPMKNSGAFIQETIQSLLVQSFSDFEIIVVNDGSSDNCQELVESFTDKRIKIIQGQSKGISSALNQALNVAQGQYVCRCDADDLYPVDRLSNQVKWMEGHPGHIAVAGKFSSMDEKSHVIAEFNTGEMECEITSELLTGNTRTHLGTFLVKLAIVKKLKGFREYFVTAEDIDIQLRLAEMGRITYLPENMYFYRIHNSSITHVQGSNKRIFYEGIAREFLKQRVKNGEDQLDRGMPPKPPLVTNQPTDSTDQIIGYMVGESWRLHSCGEKRKAFGMLVKAGMKKPMKWQVWKSLIMIMLK